MKMRPTDENGDILPVLSGAAMASGPEAVVALVRDRLNLLAGEWWENPARGCGIFDMLRSGRVTPQDAPALVSYLSSYIQSTPGVRAVEDVSFTVSGRQFSFFCRVLTEEGSGEVSYSLEI